MTGNTIRKILVPVDLSENSLQALAAGVSMAKEHETVLQILNVEESFFTLSGNFNPEKISAQANVFTALKESIEKTKEIKPSVLQKRGSVAETIISTAIAENSDLIVLGKYGASGSREGFMGTNAYSVIKYAPCPVLVATPQKSAVAYRNVLFPIRAIPGSLLRYISFRDFMLPGSTIQVLGLSELKMERETEVMDKISSGINELAQVDKIKISTAWLKSGPGAQDILQFAARHKSDLIIITSAFEPVAKPHYIGPLKQQLLNMSPLSLFIT